MGILRPVATSEPRAASVAPSVWPGPVSWSSTLQWDLNGLTLSRLQSHCSRCSIHSLARLLSSLLFCRPAFWIQILVSARKHQSCHAAASAVFYQGMDHLQPTHSPPPTATKNSPGEKCYYKKGWLLCDSHCFIKKIFFSPNKFSVKKSKGFPKPQQTRTAHDSIFIGLPLHWRFLGPSAGDTYIRSALCCTWPSG